MLLDQHQLQAFLVSAARLAAWLLILGVIFMPLERLFPRHPQKTFRTATAVDLGFYFVNGLVPGLLLAVPLSLVAWGAHRIVPSSLFATVAAWPLWMRVVAGLVIGEFGFYWGHRWSHEIPFLWRFHAVHHSPEHIYFLVSAHAHPLDFVFVRLCGLIPLYVLGLASPLAVSGNLVPLLIVLVATVWSFFVHANLRWRLGPLEWLISSPAFHHWHHTLHEPRDRNYASMLPWMDRIFGTYFLPRNEWPSAYGSEVKLPRSLIGKLLHPLRAGPPQVSSAEHVAASPR